MRNESGMNGLVYTDLFMFKKASVVNSPFVNILYLDLSKHFVCVSDVFCESGRVKVYDSLKHDGVVSDELKNLVECLYGGACEIEIVDVQQQTECECGVFAIAFALCIVKGLNPENVSFKRGMREHLLKCMNDDCLTLFPMD